MRSTNLIIVEEDLNLVGIAVHVHLASAELMLKNNSLSNLSCRVISVSKQYEIMFFKLKLLHNVARGKPTMFGLV
jgi:hypothetical protein